MFRVVREGLDPLATTGSLKAGGRFNPPNEFGALYTSLEATSAAKEVARGLRQRGVDPDQLPEGAWWVYELEVKSEAVLDLTDADVLQKSGIAEGSLTGSDVNATRQIAAEARERGYVFSGIFVLILHHHDLQIFDDLSSADTVSQSDAQ